ncbi:L,D-transpeptidase family protein [Bradyrhizobium sediminis]|uniref:L,D-transpeptidase family protein n=1 Tax=Bradyrhizobium sediminis TaxID=2840469 RepID=A0A975NQK6_9BRAD|nr:L,D-transpeptidase [Bradyrhizobium sediminis]QWG19538.1 L,D-transpeptidase family protein [Bradyrhizobium sediminis]
MMIKRTLTICAALAAGAAGTSLGSSLALAQGYSQTPGQVYSASPAPYPPGGYVVDERRLPGAPDFDALEDDDGPNAQGSTALLPPGPVLSPADPRYGRPDPARPLYSDRGAPTGPVLSPDDPRYGRPAGPPPVIYSDRPAGPPQQTYSDRGNDTLRPPEAVGAPAGVTGAVQPQQSQGADGKPLVLSALPPEEQPEVAPAQLPPNLRRQEVHFVTKEPPGTLVVDTPNTYLYYVLGGGRAVRYGVRVGRDGFTWTGVQKITRKAEWPDWHPPTEMIERQPYLPRFMAGGPGNPLGARAMYLGSTVYRIHGTNQPSTIGKFVSSGCIGMLNEDVSDLFERVKVGTRVVVLPGGPPPGTATASAQPAPAPGSAQASNAPVPGMAPTVVPPLPAPVTVR